MPINITAEGIVDQPIKTVWKIITNPQKFNALKLPFYYGAYLNGGPSPGATFRGKSIFSSGGNGSLFKIIDCIENKEFSYGEGSTWTFHYALEDQQSRTKVKFTRYFGEKTLWENIFGIRSVRKKEIDSVTLATLESLEHACDHLRRYGEDGLHVNHFPQK